MRYWYIPLKETKISSSGHNKFQKIPLTFPKKEIPLISLKKKKEDTIDLS